MKKIVLTMALCCAVVSATHAEEIVKPDINNDALFKCQAEAKSDTRLSCYDKILPPKTVADVKPVAGVGKWQLTTNTSPIDDSENVIIIHPANNSFRADFGRSITPDLYITCREKKTELFIHWKTFLGMEQIKMLSRIDKQKAKTEIWNISNDNKSVFYRGNVLEFIKSLRQANVLLAQITPFNENTINVTFDLAGLPEALKPLQKECGWQ